MSLKAALRDSAAYGIMAELSMSNIPVIMSLQGRLANYVWWLSVVTQPTVEYMSPLGYTHNNHVCSFGAIAQPMVKVGSTRDPY